MKMEVDFSKAATFIREKKAELVLLQIPEGLKHRAKELAQALERKSGAQVITLLDPNYGSCDIADDKAIRLGAQVLVHVGHQQMIASEVPIVYVPARYDLDGKALAKTLLKELKKRKLKNIALVSSDQFTEYQKAIQQALEKNQIKCFIGKGDNRVQFMEGRVLGCNFSSAHDAESRSQAIVYLGDGLFHPLIGAYASEKKLLAFNPFTKEFKDLSNERERFLRQRWGMIASAKNAKTFGILLSTKKGQLYQRKALQLKKLIEENGKQALLLAGDFVKPEYLAGIEVDALVNTACTRLAIDDWKSFPKPILNPKELEIVLGKRKEYELDELV